jgi:light-regulated signal transduction histidine kinase (bacteriophytochrome)
VQTASKRQAKYEIEDLQTAVERELQLRVQAEDSLRRTRQNFEEFILGAAHDLREPLRTVKAYSDLAGNADTGNIEQFRRYALDGTARMQALIAGMVDCATAMSDNGHLFAVDMNHVFEEAAKASRSQPGLNAAAVSWDALPVVNGNYGKLVKVAQHLLDNAARYCEAAEPRVHVSCRKQDTEWWFMVADNGPGIEAVYQHRIFEPFKRLHGREQPGSGLGLAYCRIALESHGGRIWVESKAGQGSTFFFSLPHAE